jgi:hypothetical protein
MGLSLDSDPSVSPRTIPASGGLVTVSFNVSGVPSKTRLKTVYSIPDDVPYVFSPQNAKQVDRDPVDVPASGRTVSNRLTLKKSPPNGPSQAFVPIDLELQELDNAGNVMDTQAAPPILVDIGN